MAQSAGCQLTLGLLEHECLIDALLDKARCTECVEELLGTWLRGEGNMRCGFCPEECWASRTLNLLRPEAIRRRLAGRGDTGRLKSRCHQ